ncbi:RICIN domain-containing protein [Kitasatospora purpeofusca]|uniref:RICIN domain-containing protein n=1 Tax=Kitasatospora purpeofusca TaxID=67352 RepID=A0ABZ1TYL4_9ACTN|nr:hypothetical protein [Kitasatospora purpeofusca]
MSTLTRTRRFLAVLGAVAAVAGAAVVTAPTVHAAGCELAPTLHTPEKVYNGAGGVLDLPSDNEANGQWIGVYTPNNQSTAQTWSFWGYCDGTTAISHGGEGKVADLDTRSGTVRLWDTPDGWEGLNHPAGAGIPANQKWLLADEDRGWYLIRDMATWQCLTSKGVAQPTTVTSCDPADAAQRWMLR